MFSPSALSALARAFPPPISGLDRLELAKTLLPEHDLRIRGCVTWVGNSSMEIAITADSRSDGDKWEQVLTSCASGVGRFSKVMWLIHRCASSWLRSDFTMVARCALTQKSIKINRLDLQNDEERAVFAAGEQRKEERVAERKVSDGSMQ